MPLYHYLVVARIAQLVEQLTLNQLVPGSNPGAGTFPRFDNNGREVSALLLSSRLEAIRVRVGAQEDDSGPSGG